MTGGPTRAEETGGPPDPGRRRLLKATAVGVGAVGLAAVLPPPAVAADVGELAEEHAPDAALLVDLTKCTGCGSCVAACKLQNGLEWRQDQPALGPDAALASANWSAVRTAGRAPDGDVRYVKTQCLHCLEPACASACFVKALRKSEAGPVVYDGARCVGCRYCILACPFGVPTFEWDETFGRIGKCQMCASRISRGEPTACAEACPSGAVSYGTREEMLGLAHERVRTGSGGYVPHVYGETEAGGTSVLYVSDVPFETLGFVASAPLKPLPTYTWEIARLLPPIAAGLLAMLVVLHARRQRELEHREAEREGVAP